MEIDTISGRIASRSANCYTWGVKFRVTIESDEDGVFVAECPALPGCISQGKTRDERWRIFVTPFRAMSRV